MTNIRWLHYPLMSRNYSSQLLDTGGVVAVLYPTLTVLYSLHRTPRGFLTFYFPFPGFLPRSPSCSKKQKSPWKRRSFFKNCDTFLFSQESRETASCMQIGNLGHESVMARSGQEDVSVRRGSRYGGCYWSVCPDLHTERHIN